MYYWMLVVADTAPTAGEHLPGYVDDEPIYGHETPQTIAIGEPRLEEHTDGLDEFLTSDTLHLVNARPANPEDVIIDGVGAQCTDGWIVSHLDNKTQCLGPCGNDVARLCRLLEDDPDLADDLAEMEAEYCDDLEPRAKRAKDALRSAGVDAGWLEMSLSDVHQYSQLALLTAGQLPDGDTLALRKPLDTIMVDFA